MTWPHPLSRAPRDSRLPTRKYVFLRGLEIGVWSSAIHTFEDKHSIHPKAAEEKRHGIPPCCHTVYNSAKNTYIQIYTRRQDGRYYWYNFRDFYLYREVTFLYISTKEFRTVKDESFFLTKESNIYVNISHSRNILRMATVLTWRKIQVPAHWS